MQSHPSQLILTEDVLTTTQACEELRPIFGKPIDRTTLYRWALRGIGGTRLEYTKVGNALALRFACWSALCKHAPSLQSCTTVPARSA